MRRIYKTVIFDLDGTLLDTLQDLTDATNHALRQHGYPEHSIEGVRTFVGNGVRKLIERAVPAGLKASEVETVFTTFMTFYSEHCLDKTAPYPGIMNALHTLKAQGFRMAVVSNKADAVVKHLCEQFFPELIEVAEGENEAAGIGKKPSPDMVNLAVKELGVASDTCIYVGDSDVDIQTAHNADMPCISVTWGFRDEDFLREHGAEQLIHTPEQLIEVL